MLDKILVLKCLQPSEIISNVDFQQVSCFSSIGRSVIFPLHGFYQGSHVTAQRIFARVLIGFRI